jgi:ankyrin repeat protein
MLLLQSGKTALIAASEKGHTATVQALVGAGADLNLQDQVGYDLSTSCFLACRCRYLVAWCAELV